MIKSKKQMFIVIGSFALIMLLGTVSYAFFNYTRTGSVNTMRTGNIYFNTSEGTAINLTNLFPMTSTEAENANLSALPIGIEGSTSYVDGEEFVISIVDVNNTVGGKQVPLKYIATYEATSGNSIGTNTEDYYSARNSKNANIYKLTTTGDVVNGEKLLVGYIDNVGSGINGTLSIKAYVDADRIAITDTYNGPSSTPNDSNGTTGSWVNGRTVFTTTEWNSLSSNPISFKIKAESQEGIWVEDDGTIESCPGCNFIYTTNTYAYGYNFDSGGSTLEEIAQNGDTYSTNYHNIVNATGKNNFLGFTVANGKIDRAFACGIKSDNPNKGTPFCIEATGYTDDMDDLRDYNTTFLMELFGEYPTEPNGCTISYGYNDIADGVGCRNEDYVQSYLDEYDQGLISRVGYCTADNSVLSCLY